MTPPTVTTTIINADVVAGLKSLPTGSIHCCLTSPPYLALRRYLGVTPRTWNDGSQGVFGEEKHPDLYTTHLVEIFEELKRVLHPRGSFWLNLGDCYLHAGPQPSTGIHARNAVPLPTDFKRAKVFKSKKQLGMIPARAALALQSNGWILRQDNIWTKGVSGLSTFSGSVMPECLDESTPIFIRDRGWISQTTIGRLRFFPDLPEILTPSGWKRVKKVWETRKPAMSFRAGRVESIVCSPDHRFPVSSERRRLRTRVERAADIRHEGYADYLLYTTIDRFLEPTLHVWEGLALNKTLGYLVGVYAAEGGVDGTDNDGYRNRIKITIGSEEPEFRSRIESTLESLGLTFKVTKDPRHKALYFHFNGEWVRTLVSTFVPGKCNNKRFNMELLLNAPREFREGILDGYLEGDGHDRGERGWTAVSASIQLRDDTKTLASSLGIITSKYDYIVVDKKTGKKRYAYWTQTPYIRMRKKKSGQEHVFQVPPRSRKLLGEERTMIDIEVEGELFLIGDGLISHNSIQDRSTWSHEHIFHLQLQDDAFYDQEGMREPLADSTRKQRESAYRGKATKDYDGAGAQNPSDTKRRILESPSLERGRNLRNVWVIPKEPFKGNHHAVWPSRLCEWIIKLGTSEKGCCPHCGAFWDRKRELSPVPKEVQERFEEQRAITAAETGRTDGYTHHKPNHRRKVVADVWVPTCTCANNDPVPCRVLDPFMGGSGRAAEVARRLGRSFVGVEASAEYVKMVQDRLGLTPDASEGEEVSLDLRGDDTDLWGV